VRHPASALRLRLPRIEKKPKRVFAERWQDFAGITKTPAQLEELYQMLQSIGRGHDALLEDQGIMHLHLGGRDSDVLVFPIRYSDWIVLLESNTHVHFRTQPADKNILALN